MNSSKFINFFQKWLKLNPVSCFKAKSLIYFIMPPFMTVVSPPRHVSDSVTVKLANSTC